MFAFTNFPLARQYLLASLLVMGFATYAIGTWVARQVEESIIQRTATFTSLYVNSYVSHYLQGLSAGNELTAHDIAELDRLMQETPLGDEVVSFKVWSLDNRILYSSNPELTGRRYESNPDLAPSFAGEVTAEISDLRDPENWFERKRWDALIETYAPIFSLNDGRVIAVSEFYQQPDQLQADVRRAQRSVWLVVIGAMSLAYLVLAGLVGRASNMILAQKQSLEDQIQTNERLHRQVERAVAQTTTLNERFLRRISADLHDGPVQDLALALLRIEPLSEAWLRWGDDASTPVATDFRIVKGAIASALTEIREIATGLSLPHLEQLTLPETIQRALSTYEQKTGRKVHLVSCELPPEVSLSLKITIYRVLQEALINGYHHGKGLGQSVSVLIVGQEIHIDIRDRGPGFEPTIVSDNGHLGLAGMRERVRMMGGCFEVQSGRERGTLVHVQLPLGKESPSAEFSKEES